MSNALDNNNVTFNYLIIGQFPLILKLTTQNCFCWMKIIWDVVGTFVTCKTDKILEGVASSLTLNPS